MKHRSIISRAESLQILRNDLRRAALAKHAAELAEATLEDRQRIIQEIERQIEQELPRSKTWWEPDSLIH